MEKELRSISLFQGLEVTGEDTFLDVGCGGGSNCAAAASVGADVIAADIVSSHVDAATRAVEGRGAIWSPCSARPRPSTTATRP